MEGVMLHHNRKLDRELSSPRSEYFYPTSFPLCSSFNGNAVAYTPPFSFQGPAPPMNPPRAHQYYQQQQQPPLLPLPIPNNPYQNNNNKLTRHQSLSVKKSNFSGAGPKREKTKSVGNRIGAEARDVPRVLFSGIVNKDSTMFVASTVVSPPPSSLPLPTFSIRPKLSCNSKAVATDTLRRLP